MLELNKSPVLLNHLKGDMKFYIYTYKHELS
jgi:hypothetical protein